jgi:undecaprenyl pyrophosphate phosphatase UppP
MGNKIIFVLSVALVAVQWALKALKDKKVTKFEYYELAENVIEKIGDNLGIEIDIDLDGDGA